MFIRKQQRTTQNIMHALHFDLNEWRSKLRHHGLHDDASIERHALYSNVVGHFKMKIPLTIFLAALTLSTFGQGDSTDIYLEALRYYNQHLDDKKSAEREIFIESTNGITDKFPNRVGQRAVTILTWENQKDIYNKNNDKIRHVRVFPARTNGDLIEINFTPYFAEYKGKRNGSDQYHQALSDWVIIQFKYDCAGNEFRYFRTKTGGI